MRRLSRLIYSFATASVLHLTACGGDAPRAHFADATELQKQRAITAGAGLDAAMGFFIGSILISVPPDQSTCPRITRSGNTVVATGGCTDDSGDTVRGKVIADNVPAFFGGDNDPSRPAVVTYQGFAIDDSSDDNEDLAFDGVVTLNLDTSMTAIFSASLGGVEVYSEATWRKATGAGDRTTTDSGSSIEITGLGHAEIKGSWNMTTEAPSGALELHGDDLLRADFDRIAGNCVPLTLDGQPAGQLCDETDTDTE